MTIVHYSYVPEYRPAAAAQHSLLPLLSLVAHPSPRRVAGDVLTYRMFMFKNDGVQEAARAEPANPGLQYAHPFPGGSNGCEAEVVLELNPKAGGGLSINANVEKMFASAIKTTRWCADHVYGVPSWRRFRTPFRA